VQNELLKGMTINLADADGDEQCDLNEPIGIVLVCGIDGQGENHIGYMGFRDHVTKQIVDDGVMNSE
jgi:hypothetical protein